MKLFLLAFLGASCIASELNTIPNIPLKTIKAHSRTQAENQKHAELCSKVGAIDVTDNADIQVGENTQDAAVCIGSNNTENDQGEIKSLNTQEDIKKNDTLLGISFTSIYPPSGTTTGPYYSWPIANYNNGVINQTISAEAGVPADNCYIAGNAGIQTTSGFIKLYLSCSRVLGRGATSSYMKACSLGFCQQANGTVIRN